MKKLAGYLGYFIEITTLLAFSLGELPYFLSRRYEQSSFILVLLYSIIPPALYAVSLFVEVRYYEEKILRRHNQNLLGLLVVYILVIVALSQTFILPFALGLFTGFAMFNFSTNESNWTMLKRRLRNKDIKNE